MKDLTEKQIGEIITAEFDLFNKRVFAAIDKLASDLNNITIDEAQIQAGKAIVKGQAPNLTNAYAALAGLYVTLRTAFPQLYQAKKGELK